MLAYTTLNEESGCAPNLEDFYYRGRHFCAEQLKVFSHISDCIISHNVWKQPSSKRAEYEQYQLCSLFEENFQSITYELNPLLFILVVADTLEPIKVYRQKNSSLPVEEIIAAIDIAYIPASRELIFSSISSNIDIAILHHQAQSLTDWTSVSCSPLRNNSFTLAL